MISKGSLVRSKYNDMHVDKGGIYLVMEDVYASFDGTYVEVLGKEGAPDILNVKNVEEIQ
jgi:hypothetical protein